MSETPDPIEEAVARAFCNVWGYLWDGDPDDDQNVVPEASSLDDFRPTKELFRVTARAAIAAHLAALEAAGFAVVPKEPTKLMLHAAAKAMSPARRPTPERVSCNEKHAIRYRAMIAALGGQ